METYIRPISELERTDRIFFHGGGHGPRIVEDKTGNRTPNFYSGVPVHDDGGNTGDIIHDTEHPVAGDLATRTESHVRHQTTRDDFFWRWEDDRYYRNQRQITNMIVAKTHRRGGVLTEGMKSVEEDLNRLSLGNYVGRVIPNTNDRISLLIEYADGTHLHGENRIDRMKPGDIPIKDTLVIPENYRVNPEYIEHMLKADLNVLGPGTLRGSLDPLVNQKDIIAAFRQRKSPTVLFINSINHLETRDFKGSDFIRHFVEKRGIPIDYAFLCCVENLPKNYTDLGQEPVKCDLEACRDYVQNVYAIPQLATIEQYSDEKGSRNIVRHDGQLASDLLFAILDNRLEEFIDLLKFQQVLATKRSGNGAGRLSVASIRYESL